MGRRPLPFVRVGLILATALVLVAAGWLRSVGRVHHERGAAVDCLRHVAAGLSERPEDAGALAPAAHEGTVRASIGGSGVVLFFERNESEARANAEALRQTAIAEGSSPAAAQRRIDRWGNVTAYWSERPPPRSAALVASCVRNA